MQEYVILAIVAIFLGVAIILLRNSKLIKKLALSGLGGFVALGAVNLTAALTGVSLAVNVWTACVAVFLGLPGIVALMFLKIIWNI
jgi:inhibitor of the pro-sigma K processing machinery